jgi:hypothetical protein
MVEWEKRGVIWRAASQAPWIRDRASMPIVDRVSPEVLRIYCGVLDDQHRYRATWFEVDAADPSRVLREAAEPALDLGALGAFDDSGVLPAWITDHGDRKHLYYIGWNRGHIKGLFHNSIGLAISDDGGEQWERARPGPVIDRTADEPHFTSTPCVLVEDGRWRCWYLSGIRWEMIDGKPEPLNHFKYAESDDGIYWERRGVVALDLERPGEGGLSRPCVVPGADGYEMWYCHRDLVGYRTSAAHGYRIGYATSDDGVVWQRRDHEAGIDVSLDGWDSEMIEFPYVTDVDGRRLLFYNGNDFGATGIGYAVAGS